MTHPQTPDTDALRKLCEAAEAVIAQWKAQQITDESGYAYDALSILRNSITSARDELDRLRASEAASKERVEELEAALTRACPKCGGTGDEYGPLPPPPNAAAQRSLRSTPVDAEPLENYSLTEDDLERSFGPIAPCPPAAAADRAVAGQRVSDADLRDCRAALEAFVANKTAGAGQADDPWCYDMSKAPRDGTLLYIQFREGPRVAQWMDHHFIGHMWFLPAGDCGGGQGLRESEALAWMPLPAAPPSQRQEPNK